MTISANILRLKELLDRYNIKPSHIIRRTLEDEVKVRILKDAEDELKDVKDVLVKISDEEVVKLIREDRESRYESI